ncbi:MAG: hypothetical protein K0S65_1154 [Labilithrix sp.]|nr:hypothetical protein [Labilithrix sp.]
MTKDEVLAPIAPSRSAPEPWRRRLVWIAGPLALAAAMLVYMAGQRGPSLPELPAYSIAASMGESTPPSSRLHLPSGSSREARFELSLRPATPPVDKVVAYAFTLDAPGAEPAPLDAKVEIAPDGSVRLTGRPRVLEGAREIRVVVGEPAAIGKFVDAAARAAANKTDAQVQVLVVPIDRS